MFKKYLLFALNYKYRVERKNTQNFCEPIHNQLTNDTVTNKWGKFFVLLRSTDPKNEALDIMQFCICCRFVELQQITLLWKVFFWLSLISYRMLLLIESFELALICWKKALNPYFLALFLQLWFSLNFLWFFSFIFTYIDRFLINFNLKIEKAFKDKICNLHGDYKDKIEPRLKSKSIVKTRNCRSSKKVIYT